MKIKVSKHELNECLANAIERLVNESKTHKGFEKATKKSNREIERDTYGDGFKPYDKVHKTSKDYSRKGKNKWNNNLLDEDIINISNPYDTELSYYEEKPRFRNRNSVIDDDNFVNYVTIKTDIDEVETDLLDDIKNNFTDEEVEKDTVDGLISFNVTDNKNLITRFIEFLKDNDVNIIE